MDPGEAPVWLQTALSLGAVIGAAVAAIRTGRKRDPAQPRHGEGNLVAASFMDRQTLSDLTTVIRNADSTMHLLLEELRHARETRDVEARVRDEMRKRGLTP